MRRAARWIPWSLCALAGAASAPRVAAEDPVASDVVRLESSNGSAVALVTPAHRTPGDLLAIFSEFRLLDQGVVRLLSERPEVLVVNCDPQQMEAALALVRRLDTPVPVVHLEIEILRRLPSEAGGAAITYRGALTATVGSAVKGTLSSDRTTLAAQSSDGTTLRLAASSLRESLAVRLLPLHVGAASAAVDLELRAEEAAPDDVAGEQPPRHAWTLETRLTLPVGVRTRVGNLARERDDTASAETVEVFLTVRRG